MARHRTAQGKILDMAALIARNEKVRAVGNMKVNARGDTIDDMDKIVVPVTQKVGQKYSQTVGNRSANVKKQAPMPTNEALTKEEQDLDSALNDDIEIEQIKAKETKK